MVLVLLYLANKPLNVLGACNVCRNANSFAFDAGKLVELVDSLPNSLRAVPFSSGDNNGFSTSE